MGSAEIKGEIINSRNSKTVWSKNKVQVTFSLARSSQDVTLIGGKQYIDVHINRCTYIQSYILEYTVEIMIYLPSQGGPPATAACQSLVVIHSFYSAIIRPRTSHLLVSLTYSAAPFRCNANLPLHTSKM